MQSLMMHINVNSHFKEKEIFFLFFVDRLYAVSGKSGKHPALGFTFSVHPDSFGELIALWEPNDVRAFFFFS